ncbi:hypothetical protein [Rudaea sp.]|uniref:hypothetical protein n=1 Tax=Rudaea sp. TaxID=2136325 RepID=UPI00321FE219
MTNDSALFFAIGWAVVFIFIATAVVTLLGLIGRVKLKESYLKILFVKLILEVIVAAFFLFYQGPTTRYEALLQEYERVVPEKIVVYGPQANVASYESSPPGTGESVADCPKGWLFLEGGIGPQPVYTPFDVVKTERTDNGIKIIGRNHAGDQHGLQPLIARAVCSRPILSIK